jgi:hypothetical protein
MDAEQLIKAWAAKLAYAEHEQGYRDLDIEPFTAADVESVEFGHDCEDDEYGWGQENYVLVTLASDARVPRRIAIPPLDRFPQLLQAILDASPPPRRAVIPYAHEGP